ncbi:MAG: KH domain-containing protein [Candidatus Nezhaarchaeales archaeon]
MYHVMVYSRGFVSEYEHPYAVHLFTSEKPSPEEAFRIAEDVLAKAFPEWKELEGRGLAYVGYEYVPLDMPPEADKSYVATSFVYVGWHRFEIGGVVSTIPQQLASAIREYRERFVTLDYDDDYASTRASIIDALDYLSREGYRNIKVFKTHRGYHVRAELPSPQPLDKIFEVRRMLKEDYSRIAIDRAYIEKSLDFLTNLLFNSKCWVEFPSSILKCYEEKEIDPSTITTERVEHTSINLPKMRIELPKGVVEIDGKQVKFVGRFTERDVKAIATSIEDNLWEYAYALEKRGDIKEKVKNAYRKVSPFLASLIDDCEVRLEDGAVVIQVPDSLTNYVGRLIGKQGQNIRAVESELGVRIRISQGQLPEEVAMKRKLRELLKSVIE